MITTYAEGPFFSITIEDGLVTCHVWSRPDIAWAEGARFAETLAQALTTLAVGPREQARALVVDEREAAPAIGPQTQMVMGSMLASWERRSRRIACVFGSNAVKGLQARRLLAEWAPKHGRAFASIEEARAWALGQGASQRPEKT